jgi:hypothetical protein
LELQDRELEVDAEVEDFWELDDRELEVDAEEEDF